MGVRTATFLSACLLVLKGYVCQTINTSSVAVSGASSQCGTANTITVPAIIKPIIQPYESNNNLVAPSVPNYGSVMPTPGPMPPIIIEGGNGGSGNNWLNLLFLLFILNNNRRGNGNGCGGNYNKGCNGGCVGGYGGGYGSGYGGGYGSGYGGGYGSGYGGGPVQEYYDVGIYDSITYTNGNSGGYGGGSYANANAAANAGSYGGYGGSYAGANAGANAGSYGYGGNNGYGGTTNIAEIAVTEGYLVEEPVATNPFHYQTIQPYPGREPNEICLIVKTDYPPC